MFDPSWVNLMYNINLTMFGQFEDHCRGSGEERGGQHDTDLVDVGERRKIRRLRSIRGGREREGKEEPTRREREREREREGRKGELN